VSTIAIVGASNDRSKFGNKAVRAFVQNFREEFQYHIDHKHCLVGGHAHQQRAAA